MNELTHPDNDITTAPPHTSPTHHPHTSPLPPLHTAEVAPQEPPEPVIHTPSQSQSTSKLNISHNSSRWSHRTETDLSESPPNSPHHITHNPPQSPSVSSKATPTPTLSLSHPDPLLQTSVTFTSSVSSHIYSPLCSSSTSFLHALDPLGSPIGLSPPVSSAHHQPTTPPPALSPPPPALTPPPTQLLGSDDEEQEDPSDYCRGEIHCQRQLSNKV